MLTLLPVEDVTFRIGGLLLRARRDPPATVAPLVVGAVALNRRGQRRYDARSAVGLLAGLVDPDDSDRLVAALGRRSPPVGLRAVGEAGVWLVEQATDRDYGEARTLAAWLLASWGDVRGRLLLRGAAPPETLADVCDLAKALLIEETDGMAVKRRQALSRAITTAWPDKTTWGSGAAAGQGAEAFMAMMGGDGGA